MVGKQWMLGLVLFASISSLAFTADFITSDKEFRGRTVILVMGRMPAGIQGFMQTQVIILRSKETLLRVVNKLNLRLRWSLSEAEAAAKLFRMLETSVEPGTDLITIEVYSTSRDEAAELALAITNAYFERRMTPERERLRGRAMASEAMAERWETESKDLQEKQLVQEASLCTAFQGKENADLARLQATYDIAQKALKVKVEMLDELRRQIGKAQEGCGPPVETGTIYELDRPEPTPARPDPLLLIPSALGTGLFYSIIVAFVIVKIRVYRSSRARAPAAEEPAAAW